MCVVQWMYRFLLTFVFAECGVCSVNAHPGHPVVNGAAFGRMVYPLNNRPVFQPPPCSPVLPTPFNTHLPPISPAAATYPLQQTYHVFNTAGFGQMVRPLPLNDWRLFQPLRQLPPLPPPPPFSTMLPSLPPPADANYVLGNRYRSPHRYSPYGRPC